MLQAEDLWLQERVRGLWLGVHLLRSLRSTLLRHDALHDWPQCVSRANYQGFCISAREDGTIIMNNLGATSIHAKVAPVAASMERPQTLAPPPPPPPDPASAERPIHTIICGIEGSEIVVNLDSSPPPMNIHGTSVPPSILWVDSRAVQAVNRPPSGDDSTLQFL